jgi:hypothetical protein
MLAQRSSPITRRDFLNLGGLGLASLFVSRLDDLSAPVTEQQGRVIEQKISLYNIPSFQGKEVKVYWRDMVLPISGVSVGEDETAYNRIWYHIGQEGYAYSGVIQPVQTQVNQPVADIPESGVLAEVTVPYTDARWWPGKDQFFAYRYYYETTYWVNGLVLDAQGDPWYRVPDDKWELTFFVPAQHLRIIPTEELTPLSPDLLPVAKRLEVRTAEQVVIAYEWDHPVYMARAATGADFSNGRYRTPAGRFMTFHKRPYRHMAAGDLASNGYDLPGVPWISYFTESGVSFHGTYWHNDFGRPRSHGCVNLTPRAAKWIYRWTLPSVPLGEQFVYENYGTIVDVIY